MFSKNVLNTEPKLWWVATYLANSEDEFITDLYREDVSKEKCVFFTVTLRWQRVTLCYKANCSQVIIITEFSKLV